METPAETKLLLRRTAHFLLDSGLIEGAAAGGALAVFVFVWQIFLLLSLVLATGVYFGVLLLRPNRHRILVDPMAASETQRALAGMEARVAHIEAGAAHIPVPAARTQLHSTVQTACGILADFRERPRHLSGARFVLESLLDATVMALNRYQKFSRLSGPAAQRGREVLERRVFPTIARGFQQLLEKLMQDDLRALNVDVVVLEQMLDLEGLSEAEPQCKERP